MAASLPAAQANSRTAQSAAAARRAGGASLTWPEQQARIIREIQGGERHLTMRYRPGVVKDLCLDSERL